MSTQKYNTTRFLDLKIKVQERMVMLKKGSKRKGKGRAKKERKKL
jgi:hypothetical protein